ncbi:putative glutathione S-transferase [Rosellinia necatrix]|uniref:Putative glutathione S-transferase n=1 Tax=Rosellinia necatrix TaxID=77044 RepID=A0A1S8AAP2_ROSNE|nr:putative glutathione S-transferase [Rosellinia necatrix]
MLSTHASEKRVRVFELYDAVKERPRIKECLAPERRQSYSQGIHRYYPELDFGGEDMPPIGDPKQLDMWAILDMPFSWPGCF